MKKSSTDHRPVIVDVPESVTFMMTRDDLRRRLPRLLLPSKVAAFFFKIEIFDCSVCGECFVRCERMHPTQIAHCPRRNLAHLDLVFCSMWKVYMGWED